MVPLRWQASRVVVVAGVVLAGSPMGLFRRRRFVERLGFMLCRVVGSLANLVLEVVSVSPIWAFDGIHPWGVFLVWRLC